MLNFKQFLNKKCKETIPVGIVSLGLITKNIHESLDDIHNELESKENFTPEQLQQIKRHAASSFQTNSSLIALHHLGETAEDKTIHGTHIPTLDSVVNKPLNKKITVYSAIGMDPRKNVDSIGRMHLPCYTSTSYDRDVAHVFSGEDNSIKNRGHLLKLDLNADDKGAYLGSHGNKEEREILLPRNTTIRIHKSEKLPDGTMMHHATIERGVDKEEIQRDPSNIDSLDSNFHMEMMKKGSGLSARHLSLLSKMKNFGMIYRLHGKNATEEDITNGLNHENPAVRTLAASHPNATEDQLDKALEDEHPNVRTAASVNLFSKL